MKKNTVSIRIHGQYEKEPVRIVSDAIVATTGVGDGRMIPLLIVDTSNRPDVRELVRVHEHISPGDVECCWTQLERHAGTFSLVLEFIRPSELTLIIEFDVIKQGGLVDLVIAAKGLYLQPGKPGDRFVRTLNTPRILIDTGDLEVQKYWDLIFHKHMARHLREGGLSRQESKRAAENLIHEWRKFGSMRLGRKEQL